MKVLLISSAGGHFNALQKLSLFWGQYDCCWVTFKTPITEAALKQKHVYWAYGPTNRNLLNLVRNFFLAFRVILREKPQLIVTTGAGVAVPFVIVGKLLGAKTAFVESFTRIRQLSLSARLTMPFLDVVYVHWEQLKQRHAKAELIAANLP